MPTSSTAINFVSAKCADITCYGMDTMQFTITVTDADNNPIDVTGYGFEMEVRTRGISPNVLLTFTTLDSSITVSNNVITFLKNVDIPGGNYAYDLKTLNNGVETAWLFGGFKVIQNVTNIDLA